MSKTPKGVRQVGENVIQPGRALVITNENYDEFDWNHIPNGTLHVDEETGVISVKLKGETTWVPAGIKDDGTLVISRDTQLCDEVFTVTNPNSSETEFIYENAEGKQRYKPKDEEGYVFELESGTYLMGRNHLEVTIDGVLTRTVMNGGIKELSETRFKLLDELIEGQKVAVRYVKWIKIGNPYPRFFLNSSEPETAEIGDMWVDSNATLEEGSILEDLDNNRNLTVEWNQITGTPTTLSGYGIKENLALKGHLHKVVDITDFPKSLPANGGDAATIDGHKVGDAPGNIPILNSDGTLDINIFPQNYLTEGGYIYIQADRPSNPKNKALWFCTADNESIKPHIEVFESNKWVKFGSVWKG